MSYIGSTPTTQSFIAGTDYFNGTGSAVNFTLSRSVNSVNDIEVIVNNVEQIPSGYSVSGTTLTFSAAPSAGTSNVYVRYLSTTNLSLAIPAGTSAAFNTVTATTLAMTGTITPSQTAGIVGTTTSNSANAGSVGEFIDSAATNVTVGTSATNLTSISLTAGDWDVSGIVQFYGGGAVTFVSGAINTTSASFTGTSIGKSQVFAATYAAGGIGAATLPSLRYSVSTTTTLYLIGSLSASQQCYGYISARRIR